jgi:hypothetical protein
MSSCEHMNEPANSIQKKKNLTSIVTISFLNDTLIWGGSKSQGLFYILKADITQTTIIKTVIISLFLEYADGIDLSIFVNPIWYTANKY